jgi:cobalt/nickel transport system permease protein
VKVLDRVPTVVLSVPGPAGAADAARGARRQTNYQRRSSNMHMADALISPATGATFWATSAALIAWCARRVRQTEDDRLVPMMGVLGAFVFAAQMINFTIPGTGSSGHIGGGLLLAMLLGPHAGFLVIASVLAVQALFFADGGLLALGCNIFNLGFFPAFIAWPLIFRPLAGGARGGARFWIATTVAAVAGLQLGALAVVAQTRLSGLSELPTGTFLLLMQPIHLAIGLVEGLATAAVAAFVLKARPEALAPVAGGESAGRRAWRPLALGLAAAAALVGGVGSWFASAHPDGLEWSIARTAGSEEIAGASSPLHERATAFQEISSVLPDYALPAPPADGEAAGQPAAWPAVDGGTTLAGLAGGLVMLLLGLLLALGLKPRRTAA